MVRSCPRVCADGPARMAGQCGTCVVVPARARMDRAPAQPREAPLTSCPRVRGWTGNVAADPMSGKSCPRVRGWTPRRYIHLFDLAVVPACADGLQTITSKFSIDCSWPRWRRWIDQGRWCERPRRRRTRACADGPYAAQSLDLVLLVVPARAWMACVRELPRLDPHRRTVVPAPARMSLPILTILGSKQDQRSARRLVQLRRPRACADGPKLAPT